MRAKWHKVVIEGDKVWVDGVRKRKMPLYNGKTLAQLIGGDFNGIVKLPPKAGESFAMIRDGEQKSR